MIRTSLVLAIKEKKPTKEEVRLLLRQHFLEMLDEAENRNHIVGYLYSSPPAHVLRLDFDTVMERLAVTIPTCD